MLDIPIWDFDNQAQRPLPTPVAVQGRRRRAGDLQPRRVPAPHVLPASGGQPRYVVWGDGTTDEMCLGIVIRDSGTGTPGILTGRRGRVELGRPGTRRPGVITSIAFGTVAGSMPQIGAVPPGAQTPNWNGCGVGANAARLVGAEAVLAVQHDREHPAGRRVCRAPPTGTAIVIEPGRLVGACTDTVPRSCPAASTNTGSAKPCTSIRRDQAESAAIV